MDSIKSLKRSFIRQSTEDDCGLACLAMLFAWLGDQVSMDKVLKEPVADGGCSLHDLRNISQKFGLKARCVEIDLRTLPTVKNPCILHITHSDGKGHYVLCFGPSESGFLIADPAIQVGIIPAKELEKMWVTRAAVYFEVLPARLTMKTTASWRLLYLLSSMPFSICITMAVLAVITALSGVALSWYLQKAMNSNALLEFRIVSIIFFFLTLICLFRAVTNYIKQRILISVSLMLNGQFMDTYLSALSNRNNKRRISDYEVRAVLSDIKKMQNAITALLSIVVTDGIMILLIILILAYLMPVIAILNTVFISVIAFCCFRRIPIHNFMVMSTAQRSNDFEKMILDHVQMIERQPSTCAYLASSNRDRLLSAERFAVQASKFMCLVESLGIIMSVTAISISFALFIAGDAPFSSVIAASILTFIISNLLPKVYSAFETVSAGADAALQFHRCVRKT